MGLKTVKRLAANLLGVGESHVKILDAKRASEALTRDDVRGLLKEGVVFVEHKKGVGRGKARFKQDRKHAGRRRGVGSRKGSKRIEKKIWMKRVRALRRVLKRFSDSMDSRAYRNAYKKIKGGYFKNKRHLVSFLKEKKILVRQ
jgi:large subunit ribosomal protein L19e